MSITQNLLNIKNTLPSEVVLVAVSKTKPLEDILEAYKAGQRIFGENKVQDMTDKYQALPKDIEWHMIGHVQRNKVKYMAPFVSLIHGVDSFRLLKEIDKQAKRNDRVISCLLQVFIAEEESKFGLSEAELEEILTHPDFLQLENIKIKGLMGMATFTDDTQKIRKEFSYLKQLFDQIKTKHSQTAPLDMQIISMGMSNDYQIAIECGSTMVRIGSTIFGERNY